MRLNPRPDKKTEKVEKEALWEPERALLPEVGERRDKGGWSGGKVRFGGPWVGPDQKDGGASPVLGATGVKKWLRGVRGWSEMSEVRCGVGGFPPVVVTPFGRLGGRVQPPRRGGAVGWPSCGHNYCVGIIMYGSMGTNVEEPTILLFRHSCNILNKIHKFLLVWDVCLLCILCFSILSFFSNKQVI